MIQTAIRYIRRRSTLPILTCVCFVSIFAINCKPKIDEDSPVSTTTEREIHYPEDYIEVVSKQIDYVLESSDSTTREIRLWINNELFEPDWVKIIKFMNDTTYNKSVTYYTTGRFWERLTVDSMSVVQRISPISIDSIFNALEALQFHTAESQPDSIRRRINDGTTYIIEVKNGNYNKLIHANSPEYFSDPVDVTFSNLLTYLSELFGSTFDKNVKKYQ